MILRTVPEFSFWMNPEALWSKKLQRKEYKESSELGEVGKRGVLRNSFSDLSSLALILKVLLIMSDILSFLGTLR